MTNKCVNIPMCMYVFFFVYYGVSFDVLYENINHLIIGRMNKKKSFSLCLFLLLFCSFVLKCFMWKFFNKKEKPHGQIHFSLIWLT